MAENPTYIHDTPNAIENTGDLEVDIPHILQVLGVDMPKEMQSRIAWLSVEEQKAVLTSLAQEVWKINTHTKTLIASRDRDLFTHG